MIIRAVKDGKNVENGDVSINLAYENLSCPVIGGASIKRSTNDSGLCELNLGIYDDAHYTVNVRSKDIFYEYFGQENVTIIDETTSLTIELDEQRTRWWMAAMLFIGVFIFILTKNNKLKICR